MASKRKSWVEISRRAFLQGSSLFLTVPAMQIGQGSEAIGSPKLSIGLVTDLHHADKATVGTRHYRETLDKLAEAATQFAQDRVAFTVELGDLIDAADSVDVELGYLKTVNREFSAISKERHYVLGNHCVDTLNKDEFLGEVGQPKSFYSFDRNDFHFVVLDSCFRSDGTPYGRKNFQWTDANIPPHELEWLEADLKSNPKPTLVFAHQRLDVSNHYGVKNGGEVRKVLEASGKVLAVLQGHSHQNDLNEIGGIHYCTFVAMVEGSGVENNGYARVDLHEDGTIHIAGFRKQQNHDWKQQ